jgi:hypothetical protein
LPKSLGGSRLSGKIAWGVPLFRVYCVFINKCFEICLREVLYLVFTLPLTPLCAYMIPYDTEKNQLWNSNLNNSFSKIILTTLVGALYGIEKSKVRFLPAIHIAGFPRTLFLELMILVLPFILLNSTKIEDPYPLPDFLITPCTPSKEFENDCAAMFKKS